MSYDNTDANDAPTEREAAHVAIVAHYTAHGTNGACEALDQMRGSDAWQYYGETLRDGEPRQQGAQVRDILAADGCDLSRIQDLEAIGVGWIDAVETLERAKEAEINDGIGLVIERLYQVLKTS